MLLPRLNHPDEIHALSRLHLKVERLSGRSSTWWAYRGLCSSSRYHCWSADLSDTSMEYLFPTCRSILYSWLRCSRASLSSTHSWYSKFRGQLGISGETSCWSCSRRKPEKTDLRKNS